MVRPLSREEMQKLDEMFGGGPQTAAGLMGGGSSLGAVDTQGGKFSGETDGTGFVNADSYLKANEGKGIKLGEQITAGATGVTNDMNSNISTIKNASVPVFKPSDKLANAEKIDAELGGGAPLNPDAAYDSRSRAWQDVIDEVNSGAGRYKYDSSGIDSAKSGLDKLKTGDKEKGVKGADDWLSTLGDNQGSRSVRSQLLRDKAKEQKISGYGDGSTEFDSMFLEAESPDLIKNKKDSLQKAYDEAFGTSLNDLYQKLKSDGKAQEDASDSYYREAKIKGELGKAKVEQDREAKSKQDAIKNGSSGDITPPPERTVVRKEEDWQRIGSWGNSPGFNKNDITYYSDGTKEVRNSSGEVYVYDKDGNLISTNTNNVVFT